ncbi:MAG TPA: 5-methyltetrahydropteroyltriglutamate--homocysteine S-methyltransferase [Polyangiaceae bacterium]|nr:5-methyltetrahydropteroyltriglutamate--homocysteine S-methyltransferase [Polyangiaceae bacterium]
MMATTAGCLGYPRIGKARELKRALELYWQGRSTPDELERVASALRRENWLTMRDAGVDHLPSNDFSLYDHVLDMAVTLGVVPARYRAIEDPLDRYFAMARGRQDAATGIDVPAMEMTKWFDTNYHYIVPELEADQAFRLDGSKIFRELREARALGLRTRPVILGPCSFLLLSKLGSGMEPSRSRWSFLEPLLRLYEELFIRLAAEGVTDVQLDEPCLVLELDEQAQDLYELTFERLSRLAPRPKILLTTYFGPLRENLPLALRSGFEGLHVDVVRGEEDVEAILDGLPPSMSLSLGVVDGRNVWRTHLDIANEQVARFRTRFGADRLQVAPSCSLLHVPVDLSTEARLDPEIRPWLAFAAQKLGEVRALADAAGTPTPQNDAFASSRLAASSRRLSLRTRKPEVRARVSAIEPGMLRRASEFDARSEKQRARFALPPLPTTTIGSFPQTSDVRGARAAFRAGKATEAEYEAFLRAETRRCVEKQEALGLDVLVHGEFERTDMVEYFGEKLDGFAITENGWVQSYGSRCVKPPILFGDLTRPSPMTVPWSRYAQSLTNRPMKGMLTGPVTILQWSFVRNDLPREDTCRQIALVLRDELADLESAGLGMVQVDEPAIREGLPLRKRDWNTYLRWAVDAFRLATAGVRDETQIHSHMCYSEFGDILSSIAEMDADVLSMETSRSRMELLADFARFDYPNDIGPGVYDIHSPRVPTSTEMVDLLRLAARVVPPRRLWVNPDCGLKTRAWPEVERALAEMVAAARIARAELGGLPS